MVIQTFLALGWHHDSDYKHLSYSDYVFYNKLLKHSVFVWYAFPPSRNIIPIYDDYTVIIH